MTIHLDPTILDVAINIAVAQIPDKQIRRRARRSLLRRSWRELWSGRADTATIASILTVWGQRHRSMGLPLPSRAELWQWACSLPQRAAEINALQGGER